MVDLSLTFFFLYFFPVFSRLSNLFNGVLIQWSLSEKRIQAIESRFEHLAMVFFLTVLLSFTFLDHLRWS